MAPTTKQHGGLKNHRAWRPIAIALTIAVFLLGTWAVEEIVDQVMRWSDRMTLVQHVVVYGLYLICTCIAVCLVVGWTWGRFYS